ncbi:MAG: hypothetical protein U0T83_07325 [Bacteriovoracaceae bacterium]
MEPFQQALNYPEAAGSTAVSRAWVELLQRAIGQYKFGAVPDGSL